MDVLGFVLGDAAMEKENGSRVNVGSEATVPLGLHNPALITSDQ